MQLTHLECAIQSFLVYSQSCATITLNFRMSLSSPHPQRNPIPFQYYSKTFSSSLHQPWTTTDLLSVSIDCPMLDISYKRNHILCGISWWLLSVSIMISTFIHVVAIIHLYSSSILGQGLVDFFCKEQSSKYFNLEVRMVSAAMMQLGILAWT